MIPRVLEPEVMDDRQEATEYDSMDHDAVNRAFVTDLLAAGPLGQDCLDIGTGTALIPIELCQRERDVRVMAADASANMLDLARYRLEVNGLMSRVQLHHGDAKRMVFQDEYFDTVMSNSLVHHLPSPDSFFQEAMRVLRSGGLLFVRDLCRPETMEQLNDLVETYAGHETPTSRQMLYQSLHAALSLDEVRELASQAGISAECVQLTSDRHWTLSARKPSDVTA